MKDDKLFPAAMPLLYTCAMFTTCMHSHKPLHTHTLMCTPHASYIHLYAPGIHLHTYIVCTCITCANASCAPTCTLYTCAHTIMCQYTQTCACCSYMCHKCTSLHLHAYSPMNCSWPCYLFTYFHGSYNYRKCFFPSPPSYPTHLHPIEQNSHPLLSRADPLFTRGHTCL